MMNSADKVSFVVARRTFRTAIRRAFSSLRRLGPDSINLDVLNRRLLGAGCDPLSLEGKEAERDVASAARYVVALLASSQRLRARFPDALGAGPTGSFAGWLAAGNAGPSEAAIENVRLAFARAPTLTARYIYQLRYDVREVLPLGLTPHQRLDFLVWLLIHGQGEHGIGVDEALWYFMELCEDPSQGLATTFLFQPAWQAAVPHGLTSFGWPALKRWVGSTYDLNAPWLRRAVLGQRLGPWDEVCLVRQSAGALAFPANEARDGDADAVLRWLRSVPNIGKPAWAWRSRLRDQVRKGDPRRSGVNLIGLFLYTSGLQQAVRSTADALTACGEHISFRNVPAPVLYEVPEPVDYSGLETFDVTILNTGIDISPEDAYRQSGLFARQGVHRVAIWWWEMERLPDRYSGNAHLIDEIWAPTEFIAGAMRAAYRKPVFTMLPGIALEPFDALPRSHFGLRDDRFVFSFIFDMKSRMLRKNPLGLIKAFRLAFAPDEPVDLILKVTPQTSLYEELWDQLRTEAAKANAILLERVLTRQEVLALLSASDAYVSLHRSEGFGLTCAEAMLLGKPTIATAYSGNMDFMTADNSYLVRYDRAELTEDADPYPRGAVWAEPDLAHAASLMRAVYENRDEAARRGQRAKLDLEAKLSIKEAGRRISERLAQIRAMTAAR